MISSSFSAGLSLLRKRPGLALLIFLAQLGLALALTTTIAVQIGAALADTGFDDVLASGFDLSLWADIIEDQPTLIGGLLVSLLWSLPIIFVWNVVVGIGLTHALRDGGVRSFWTGVGRYFGKGAVLSLLYFAMVIGWAVLTGIIAFVGSLVWPGSVGVFWVNFVIAPTVLITGLSITDLMQDYGRAHLVIADRPIMQSWIDGIVFPFRHGRASWLYLLWFVPAALFWLLPSMIAAVVGTSVLIFLIQQILLLGRAAVTVAWVGSEVVLFERIADLERPLIAETEPQAAEKSAIVPDEGLEGDPPPPEEPPNEKLA